MNNGEMNQAMLPGIVGFTGTHTGLVRAFVCPGAPAVVAVVFEPPHP